MFGLETALITEKCVMEGAANDLTMLRFSLKVVRRNKMRNTIYRKNLVVMRDTQDSFQFQMMSAVIYNILSFMSWKILPIFH